MNNPTIAIINYGMGNLNSVKKAFERIGANAIVTEDIGQIKNADKLVLPGVGNFEMGIKRLKDSGLIELLNEEVLVKMKPILGICLGMQLFTSHSEEGNATGLDWIPGNTNYFKEISYKNRILPIPHMGWNSIEINHEHPILKDIPNNARFYFVHSYAVSCKNEEHVVANSEYGKWFNCIIANKNIVGTQFHPEKSHANGLKLIDNFVKYC